MILVTIGLNKRKQSKRGVILSILLTKPITTRILCLYFLSAYGAEVGRKLHPDVQFSLSSLLGMKGGTTMVVTHKLKMDFIRWGVEPHIDVVEGDAYSRNLQFTLQTNGVDYVPPEGCSVMIRYCKPDRTGGIYDTMPDGSSAWSLAGNILTVELVPQLFTAPGEVRMVICLLQGDAELHSFPMHLDVHHVPKGMPASEKYINISGFLPQAKNAVAGEFLKVTAVDENGTVTAVETGTPEGGSAEIPENVVTCDTEGSTGDESTVPINADTLGGELPDAFAKASDLAYETFNMTAAGDFKVELQRSFRMGRLVVCSCRIVTPAAVTAGWQTVATSPFTVGREVYARFPDREGTGAYMRNFIFNGYALKANLNSVDTSKTFIVLMVTRCGEIVSEAAAEEVSE